MREYDNILFCTDFSELSDIALDYACDLAHQHKSTIHIFHATAETPNWEKLDKVFKEKYLEKTHDIKTEYAATQGADHEQIVKYAKEKNMNLIVMGTHGKSGFFKDMLIGSCARQLVRKSPVPLLVVPGPERAAI